MSEKQSIKIESQETRDHVPCCCSQRWILAYVSFFGFVCLYAVRFNLSVGIVCMVKTETNNISAANNSNVTSGVCTEKLGDSDSSSQHAEFDWDKDTRSAILSSFFYGYVITQIPGGWLADRYGGRNILGTSLTICGLCTVLTPVLARTSVVAVFIVRAILGVASGVCFPSMHSMWGRWAPPLERTKLMTLYIMGPMVGNVLTFIASGYLCDYGFDNGWGSIFYITGGMSLVWVLLWFLLIRDTPAKHPWITEAERKYITGSIEYNVESKNRRTPWLDIAKSRPMYACIIAQICNAWMSYTIIISIPAFMKAVLKFDIKANGIFSALPNLSSVIVGFIAGPTADIVRKKQILNTTNTRKAFQCSAFIGSTVFILLAGFTSCQQRMLTVGYICLAMGCAGLSRAGYAVNHVDYAAKYAGLMMGITNTFANIPGILTPIVAGKLTPNDTSEEWRTVFYVCACFNAVGCLAFGLLASGDVEHWARDEETKEITLSKK